MSLPFLLTQIVACLLMGYAGTKLGLRMFGFALISLTSFYLMLMLCLNFTQPLAHILAPWVHLSILKPAIVVSICGCVLYFALRLTRYVEVILRNLSPSGNIALGGAFAVTLTLIIFQLFLQG